MERQPRYCWRERFTAPATGITYQINGERANLQRCLWILGYLDDARSVDRPVGQLMGAFAGEDDPAPSASLRAYCERLACMEVRESDVNLKED